jgi:hypothetical protein
VSNLTVIHCDNLSSIQVVKNPIFHAWTKHIEVHYHFVRERVLSGEVELQHVPTDRQIADIFTKPLGLDKLRQFLGTLGLRHLDMPNLRGREETKPNVLETANSDSKIRSEKAESNCENQSETAESDSGVDSDMLNQPRPRRIRRTQRKRQHRNSKEAVKGRMGEDADQKGGGCRPKGLMLRGIPTHPGKPECQTVGTPEKAGIPENSGTQRSRSPDPFG